MKLLFQVLSQLDRADVKAASERDEPDSRNRRVRVHRPLFMEQKEAGKGGKKRSSSREMNATVK
jgi:hypothetical protein